MMETKVYGPESTDLDWGNLEVHASFYDMDLSVDVFALCGWVQESWSEPHRGVHFVKYEGEVAASAMVQGF